MKITKFALFVAVAAMLTSCEFLRAWATETEPQVPAPVPPADEVSTLPHIGGDGYLDILVTILTAMGLLPAARIVALAKPLIAPLIRAILGRKKEQPTDISKPTVS
jgi:hypothetical protein